MNELALFAGAGGGILAAKLLGWRTVCAVEINSFCARRLMQRQNEGNLPPFPIWDDVRTFDGRPWRGIVDVVSGGFPCQDIAICGKGAGIDVEKSGLWREMARIIGEVQPKYAFVENSPMLVRRGLATVLGDLAAVGYDARWGCIGGFYVGNVANGERLWIAAYEADCPNVDGLEIRKNILFGSKESFSRQYSGAISNALSQDDFAEISGNTDDVAEGMERLKAIGNEQMPTLAATAWEILS